MFIQEMTCIHKNLRLKSWLIHILLIIFFGGCDSSPSPSPSPLECQLNSDCAEDEVCQNQVCIPALDPCLALGCGVGFRCDLDQQRCVAVECLFITDCSYGAICENGRCIIDVNADRDRDGVPDGTSEQLVDNCPDTSNAQQQDQDEDGQGDACDEDDDQDQVNDLVDNCPLTPNPIQGDANQDGLGNVCDPEVDGVSIRGSLQAKGILNPNFEEARLYFNDFESPLFPNSNGDFETPFTLSEPGLLQLTVRWAGYSTQHFLFNVPDGTTSFSLPPLEMTPLPRQRIEGQLLLEGQSVHNQVLVHAFQDEMLVDTTLSQETGRFVLDVPPQNLKIAMSKEGFFPQEVLLTYRENSGTFFHQETPLSQVRFTLRAQPQTTLRGQVESRVGPRNDWANIATVSLFNDEFRTIDGVFNDTNGRGQCPER